jgi:hypothetical protein
MSRLTQRWCQRQLRLELMDGLDDTMIIDLGEPFAHRHGSVLGR